MTVLMCLCPAASVSDNVTEVKTKEYILVEPLAKGTFGFCIIYLYISNLIEDISARVSFSFYFYTPNNLTYYD